MKESIYFERGMDMLNRLRMIFFALIAGPLLFFFVSYLMYKNGGLAPSVDLTSPSLQFTIMGFCIGVVILAYIFYVKQKYDARKKASLQEKLQALYKISLVRYVIQEGACMISVIAFFLSGEVSMQALYLVLLIGMGLGNPTIFSIMNDLKLNKQEATIIRQNLPIDEEA